MVTDTKFSLSASWLTPKMKRSPGSIVLSNLFQICLLIFKTFYTLIIHTSHHIT